jgi:hypothetical protein
MLKWKNTFSRNAYPQSALISHQAAYMEHTSSYVGCYLSNEVKPWWNFRFQPWWWWAEPRSKAPEIVHKECGSPQTTGGCNWIGHKRSSNSWEPVLSSTVDSPPHVPIQHSTTAYKLVDCCPDQLYLIDWHFPCIDWLIVKSGRSLISLQCIPISSIMMDGCRLPYSNLKVPSV